MPVLIHHLDNNLSDSLSVLDDALRWKQPSMHCDGHVESGLLNSIGDISALPVVGIRSNTLHAMRLNRFNQLLT